MHRKKVTFNGFLVGTSSGRMLSTMKKILFVFILLAIKSETIVKFTGLPAAVNISEKLPAGSSVYTFIIADTLLPIGFPFIINSNPLTKAFKINPATPNGSYAVILTGEPVLDYETMPNSFDLQIYAMDTANDTDLQMLTVQLINFNEPPFFQDNMATQPVTIYIIERTPPGVIYKIQVSDPEDPPNNLKYTINSTSADPFMVSLPESISSTKTFDYEKDAHTYFLIVRVEDPQGLFVQGTLIIHITNINDEPPYFIGPKTSVYHIPEEEKPGIVVANVTAEDPDADGFINTLLFSIDTPSQYFTINQLTGVIQIAMPIDREAEPFRQHPNIILEIVVRDSPNVEPSDRILLTFIIEDINDNPPVCSKYAFSSTVPENELKGRIVLDIAEDCKDNDVEPQYNKFNFTGLSGLGENQRFKLEPPGSGKIVVNGDLNFEDPNNLAIGNEYSLTVMIQDVASPYYKQIIFVYVKTLPINEYPPVFKNTPYIFDVSELAPANSKIGQVYATDEDLPFTGITYSIVSGGSTLGYYQVFWIDPSTGNLHLIKSLDYETLPTYNLTIQATDSESKSATVSAIVNVIEANDEKPICEPNSYSLSVSVDQVVGTNIQNFRLTCADRDSDPRSFRYFINSGNINNQFTFSPDAGSNVTSLTLASPFGYRRGLKMIWDYQLLVYITDNNLLPTKSTGVVQTGTVTLSIRVYVPGLTTLITTTPPSITYLIKRENVYSASAWYVPFIATLGSILLCGCLAYLAYLLRKCIRCCPRAKADKVPLIENKDLGKRKKDREEIIWEMTRLNTVFDGEAVDPITGKTYEYNSKSGARRWKDTKEPMYPAKEEPTVQVFPSPPVNVTEGKSKTGTPNKKENSSDNQIVKAENTKEAPKPANGGLETARQATPRLQKSREGRSSPIPSAKVAPKTPLQPILNKDNVPGDMNLGSK